MEGSFAKPPIGSGETSAVPGTRFDDVRWVDETGSTNADLLAAAADGEAAGVVLVADHQTAGHGRLGREWTAPPGSSLLVSVLLRPELAPDESFLALAAAAVAACDACRDVADCHPGIKWPNDLVIVAGDRFAGRKVAGLLAESIVRDGVLVAVVVGMGLNVNWEGRPPSELDDVAVALDRVVGHPVDREVLLRSWLVALDRWLDELDTAEGRARLRARTKDLSATVGRRVRVEQAAGAVVGDAVDITPAGHLVVAPDGGGPRIEVAVGDVVPLRHRD
jgi:BirA family biotin operon repressor/biotin-[acetyl-CoA-carboxylase] ligase